MKLLNLIQGSDEWKKARTLYLVASEAPVIMGASPHTKRDELLHLKSSGVEREIDAWVEKFVFARGHETEELARPIAEARLGEDLFQLVGVNFVSDLNLLASFDGITEFHDNHWEHKQFNKELYELVKSGGELEPKHYWQLEHQLLVNENDSCIFAVSDGAEEDYAEMVYRSRPERREQLIEGWKLFLIDLRNYIAPAIEPAKPAGEIIKDLPALIIDIAGEVKKSNLAIYKTNALDFIRNINTNLQTDEDFATAENVVKFCSNAEKELETVKTMTLGRVASIDEVMRTIDQLKEEMRQKRLVLEKLVKSEKDNRKSEILSTVKQAWHAHHESCNKALGSVRLPEIAVDFAGAMKNKRTIESLRSAANDELARAKIEANRLVNHIDVNLCLLREIASNHTFLFSDRQQLVLKDKDAVEAIARQRIAEHEATKKAEIAAEAKKLADAKIAAEKAEAEAKRISDEQAAQKLEVSKAVKEISAELDANDNSSKAFQNNSERPQAMADLDADRGPGLAGSDFVATIEASGQTTEQVRDIPVHLTTSNSGHAHLRPSDERIIEVLATNYGVSKSVVIGWLRTMNLDAAAKRNAA